MRFLDFSVIPAKAEIQSRATCGQVWMPAFAGMTPTYLTHFARLTRLAYCEFSFFALEHEETGSE